MFAAMPRWQPHDVNRAADVIVSCLQDIRIPVVLHQPELYLWIRYSASVKVDDISYRRRRRLHRPVCRVVRPLR